MGALYMGNKPLVKVDSKVSVVFEQFARLLHACGLPAVSLTRARERRLPRWATLWFAGAASTPPPCRITPL